MTKPVRRRLDELEGGFIDDQRKIAVQTTAVSKTSNATLENLPGLVHTVVPGTYQYRLYLQCTSGASGGTKVAFKYTGTVLSSLVNQSLTATAAANATAQTSTTTDQASLVAQTAANLLVILEGTIVVTTGGTIQAQGAQNASNGTATVFLAGSTFEITRVA
jgi:hypothetical protein